MGIIINSLLCEVWDFELEEGGVVLLKLKIDMSFSTHIIALNLIVKTVSIVV